MSIPKEAASTENESEKSSVSEHRPHSNRELETALGSKATKAADIESVVGPIHRDVSDEELSRVTHIATDKTIMGCLGDKKFESELMKHGLNALSDDNPTYWKVFGEFVTERMNFHEASAIEKDPGANILMLETVKVLANTPFFILCEKKLDEIRPKIDEFGYKSLTDPEKQSYNEALKEVTRYNNLLREYGQKYNPRIDQLSRCLSEMLVFIIPDEQQKPYKISLINAARGARHELGFQQLLDAAGVPYEPGTNDEDLKGIDLKIMEPGYEPLYVDIKASSVGVRKSGRGNGYVSRRPDGKLVVLSPFSDKDFEDNRFYVSPYVLEERSKHVPQLLMELRKLA